MLRPPNTTKPSSHWDPILLISQIVSVQSLHYLTLSLFIPPLLGIFAEPTSLNYEGGAANVGMVMDWREMAGRPTVRGMQGEERWSAYIGVWRGGRKIGSGLREDQWDGRTDPMRGWVIALCWLVACSADIYYLYTLIRRPRLILDFALTLVFNHLVLTTYYSASIPTSLFFWLVMVAGAAMMIIVAEQLCVKREMAEGLQVVTMQADEEVEEMEMGLLPRNAESG
ncbi:integral membrane protein S linking to the trans Golgi network-domain-containing protein [Mycena pura]|uniref:Integral membrane protein S linking to the trans Golgi network-domain-containing protein n=1 Tax=Mycena pura TaxID=153505 RepID=A0AAD7E6V6_9AGAR|nr:integral membrane protein S linking to the trans Golgi network-domain-containing protein [Mycena pura]